MVVMGIDPGSRIAGFGVVKYTAGQVQCLDGGSIHLGTGAMEYRLAALFSELSALITRHRPHTLALERVFVYKNVDSALKLGQARGVVLLSAALQHVSVAEYAPTAIKLAVTGTGAAKKSQVALMIHQLLRLNKIPQPDTADALAVALCHLNHQRQGVCDDRPPKGDRCIETAPDDHIGST